MGSETPTANSDQSPEINSLNPPTFNTSGEAQKLKEIYQNLSTSNIKIVHDPDNINFEIVPINGIKIVKLKKYLNQIIKFNGNPKQIALCIGTMCFGIFARNATSLQSMLENIFWISVSIIVCVLCIIWWFYSGSVYKINVIQSASEAYDLIKNIPVTSETK